MGLNHDAAARTGATGDSRAPNDNAPRQHDWLSPAVRARGGPLVPAAEAWLRHWPQVSGAGPRGLHALAEAMERWAEEDPDEEADRRFVEGAGATLGLLLLEHLGDGRHAAQGTTHRVRLGPRGFFDPFGAVERALESEDIRQTLAEEVMRAEAEARDRGPLSRLVKHLEDVLRHERPELQVAGQFEHHLRLVEQESQGELELDLRRAMESTADQGDGAVDGVVRKLLALLPGGDGVEVPWEEAQHRLFPRLVRTDQIQDLASGGLWHRPFHRDLSVALLLEYGDRARYVRHDEEAGWGHDAWGAALSNLARTSERARFARVDTPEGPWVVARSGDGRDSARLLLPGLAQVLRAELGEDVRIAVPHRDTLLACPATPPALVAALRERARHDFARAPHRLSEHLFSLA